MGDDGADLPVLAEVEAANLGVLLGRDHGVSPPGTRDGPATAVDGATRARGCRPHSAPRPPGARSAGPSTCQPGVCRRAPAGGKPDPSRVRDTRAGGRDDRGGLLGCGGVAGEPPPPTVRARRCDSSACSTRGRDRRRHRSRRPDDSDGRFSGGAECPRCRSSGPLPLDVPPKPWHKRQDGLGVSEPEAVTRVRRFSPDPHPQPAQPTRSLVRATAKRPWTLPAPTAIIFFLIIRPDRTDPAREVQISTLLRGYQQDQDSHRLDTDWSQIGSGQIGHSGQWPVRSGAILAPRRTRAPSVSNRCESVAGHIG